MRLSLCVILAMWLLAAGCGQTAHRASRDDAGIGGPGAEAPSTPRLAHGTMQAMRIGLAKASLESCFPADRPLADELMVCALAAEGDGGAGILLVCDLGKVRMDLATQLRQAVAQAVGLSPEQVGVAATQTHSAFGPPDPGALTIALVQAARAAWDARTEAQMALVSLEPDPPLNHNRRYIDPELGAFTFWYGYRELPDGRADVTWLLHIARQALAQGKLDLPRATTLPLEAQQVPADAPQAVLSPSDDPLVQALFFRTPDGRPIGALLRFSAHPITAAGKTGGYRSGDFPVYVRRRLEEQFGGSAMYLAGPCGDTALLVGPTKSLELSQRLGTRLADLALERLADVTWSGEASVRGHTQRVSVTLRQDLPRDIDSAHRQMNELKKRIPELAAAGDLAGAKRLQERYETLGYWAGDRYATWIPLDRQELAGAQLDYPLFVLRLGQCAIVGLPGEPFSAYSARLRQRTLGQRVLIGEQCNAGFGYIPTAEQFPLGGYGPSASAFDPDVEQTLLNGAVRALQAVGLASHPAGASPEAGAR